PKARRPACVHRTGASAAARRMRTAPCPWRAAAAHGAATCRGARPTDRAPRRSRGARKLLSSFRAPAFPLLDLCVEMLVLEISMSSTAGLPLRSPTPLQDQNAASRSRPVIVHSPRTDTPHHAPSAGYGWCLREQ